MKNSRPAQADRFADIVMERVRTEIAQLAPRTYQGQVGEATANGLNVYIEGNWIEVVWKAYGLTFVEGDIVMLVSSPSMPLTIICKRTKTV